MAATRIGRSAKLGARGAGTQPDRAELQARREKLSRSHRRASSDMQCPDPSEEPKKSAGTRPALKSLRWTVL
jgi:hypothetical protein